MAAFASRSGDLEATIRLLPPTLQAANTAFDALTPGRQRGYVLYFMGAKQSQTRTARIEKCIPKILAGLGFHDR
jgi:uncharacterized protein YdeI (YjbR/CyaY-like superfamily)